MTHGRQRNLVLLAFEKSRTNEIDLDEFVLRLGRKAHTIAIIVNGGREYDVCLKQFHCNHAEIFQRTSRQL